MDGITLTIVLSLVVSVFGQGTEYGQQCSNYTCFSSYDQIECNSTTNKCQCPVKMFRNDELRLCVSPHGEKCTLRAWNGDPSIRCTDFAQCWPTQVSNETVTLDGTCHCDVDAKYDSNTWKCKLTHGSSRCKFETQCDTYSFLTCRDGQCVCQDPDNQVYENEICTVLQGGSCSEKSPFLTPPCGKFMICNTTGICECEQGFDVTPERTCGKKYKETCQQTSDCHPQFFCSNNTCACRPGQEFHNGSCRILAGESCDANSTHGIIKCTANANCITDKCICNNGYKAREGICTALFGSVCSDNDDIPCNLDDYLECENQRCKCKDKYEADNGQKRCKGFIGQGCGNDTGNCIANSVCLSNKCACGPGQVAQEDTKRCLAVLGGACTGDTPCSNDYFLSCHNAVCICEKPDEQVPEENNGFGCVARAGASCGKSARNIKCVANSTCTVEDREYCKCDSGHANNGEGLCILIVSSGSSIYRLSSLLTFVIGVMVMGKL